MRRLARFRDWRAKWLTEHLNCRFSTSLVSTGHHLKIFLHDYPGHAFPIQLSREFARLGHVVVHAFAADLEAPRGPVARRSADPPNLTILPIVTGARMNKYSLIQRVFDERRYGAALADAV